MSLDFGVRTGVSVDARALGRYGVRGSTMLGLCANKCYWPTAGLNSRYFMAQTYHVLADDVTSIQLVYPGSYTTGGTEASDATAATITAGIAFTQSFDTPIQVLFGGVASGARAANTNLVSDRIQLPAGKGKAGTAFWVRTWIDGGAGSAKIPYTYFQKSGIDVARGEKCVSSYSALITDVTNSSSAIIGGTNQPKDWVGPCAIIGLTRKRSFFLLGDSRVFGENDATDSPKGGRGPWQRALDTKGIAWTCAAVSGDRATWTATNAQPLRLAAAQYASDQVVGFSSNDISNGRTKEQIWADLETIKYKLQTTRNIWIADCGPSHVTSSDAFTTVEGQSYTGSGIEHNTTRLALNADLALRGDFIAYADLVSTGDKFTLAYGVPTSDGAHESALLSAGIATALGERLTAK